MTLVPCAGCRRHVREDAATCPFCAHASITPRGSVGARLAAPDGASRAQILALGLLAATTATACSTVAPAPLYGGPPPSRTVAENPSESQPAASPTAPGSTGSSSSAPKPPGSAAPK